MRSATHEMSSVQQDWLTAEQSAGIVLDIVVHDFQRVAGEATKLPHLRRVWIAQDHCQQDLERGLNYAKSRQWIDSLDEGFRLTKAGFRRATLAKRRYR